MELLRLNANGFAVKSIQTKLKKLGYSVGPLDGIFGPITESAAKAFQDNCDLSIDGIIGPQTWQALLSKAYDFKFQEGIKDEPLPVEEYISELHDKRTIYLHHTAGRYNPEGVRQWWIIDKHRLNKTQWRIATAFIIGRSRFDGNDNSKDGLTYRVFEEKYWAHHLGIRRSNNRLLNTSSIGIEICNLGHLVLENGSFFRIFKQGGEEVNRIEIPEAEVCVLDTPWRGYKYFQKYTPKQLAECKRLILTLAKLYDIPIRDFKYTTDWFDLQADAFNNTPGIWTHVNVRQDKTDCFPQPELINMLNSLYTDFQTFELPAKLKKQTASNEFQGVDLSEFYGDL